MERRKSVRSPVWAYFTMVTDRQVQCNLCKERLTYCASTSNMLKHLKFKHKSVTIKTRQDGQAPQPPPPPPPKPAQVAPPPQPRPIMVKPLAPKPRPASPPQPPPPPPEVCLRWNSYHSNMQATFPALLNNEQFVDVTLACEGRSIKCHKMMLSACSSYFDELLSQNPCQHPIVLMKDLKFWEVQALVEFMYRGEVNVSQDKLPFLLAAAEALQIKGLASPTSSTPQHEDDSSMSLGMEPDYMDDMDVPSPASSRRSRKRRTIAAIPMQTTPPPAQVPNSIRSTRLQRTNNHVPVPQPSTSGYVPVPQEPPTRKRKLEGPDFDPTDHLMREIKLEPVDIDASSDSMDHTSELFQMTCEPATVYHPAAGDADGRREDADHGHPVAATAPDVGATDPLAERRLDRAGVGTTMIGNGGMTVTPCLGKSDDATDLSDKTAHPETTTTTDATELDTADEGTPDEKDRITENGTDYDSKPLDETQTASESERRHFNEDSTSSTNQNALEKTEEPPPTEPPQTAYADATVKMEEN